jgi:hypothetical protein
VLNQTRRSLLCKSTPDDLIPESDPEEEKEEIGIINIEPSASVPDEFDPIASSIK